MEDFVAYYNGEFLPQSKISLTADNLGFTRGYGAYECFRTYQREPFHLSDHLERLKHTCMQLLIPFPKEDLVAISKELIAQNLDTELVFRVYVTDNPQTNSYHLLFFCNSPQHFEKTHVLNRPLLLKATLDTRPHKDIKSTSYAIASMAIKQAKLQGYDDVLFIGKDNMVHELSRANFFAIKGNDLYTPKTNFLPGITRKTILSFANEYGFTPRIENFNLDFLTEAEEVFASSTIRGITSIAKIDDMEFDSTKKADKLQSYFKSLAYDGSHDKKHPALSHS
ncbi:aminotransferase class IV [bacterium]|nr:aminotransferase class IV [bacterium]